METAFHTLDVPPDAAGERLDRWLADALPQFTRAYLQTRIEAGDVRVDERERRKPSFRLAGGERVALAVPPAAPAPALAPEAMPLAVVYEDADVIVLDKPPGLVVHPGAGNATGTLVHGVLAHAPEVRTNDETRPGIVHRLDKDTSGLLIVAKHDAAREFVAAQLRDRTAEKRYRALVYGSPAWETRAVDAPIARDPRNRLRMAVVPGGRPSLTILHVAERLPGYTLLDVELMTGRTHQIRVHTAHIGHPVAGDATYAPRRVPPRGLTRQFLHAARLCLTLPNGEHRCFDAPLPPDLAAVLTALRAR